jgi:hypothetical protein
MTTESSVPLPDELLVGVAGLLARLEADIGGNPEGGAPCQTDELADTFFAHREAVLAWLCRSPQGSQTREGLAEALPGTYLRRFFVALYAKNQFLELDGSERARLLEEISTGLGGLADGVRCAPDEATMRRVVRRWTRREYCRMRRRARVLIPKASAFTVVAGEYTAELQLRILGMSLAGLRAPVIDLGCGQHGILVEHLRRAGLPATGLDRIAQSPATLARDWFEQPFVPDSIGTLLSHQAFSLQFLHQHFQSSEQAYRYARKYMELLRSLKVGGCFAYAPGLPFIEKMLDREQYEVRLVPLPEALDKRLSDLRDLDTGESVAYACHVVRRR